MKILRAPNAGDTIRARWAQDLIRTLNDHSRRLLSVEQEWGDIGDAVRSSQAGFMSGSAGVPAALVYTETSRTATGRTITDSNGDTFTHNSVVQVNLAATGGETLQLNFTAPT